MSAFVVGKEHINAMVRSGLSTYKYGHLSWYHGGERHHLTDETASAVGQMLLDENVKSVCARYGDDTRWPTCRGRTNAEWLLPFKFQYTHDCPTAVETLAITNCLIYQSCEHEEWEQSEAKAFCDALIGRKIRSLPGYDDAPWEWTKPIGENLLRIV